MDSEDWHWYGVTLRTLRKAKQQLEHQIDALEKGLKGA
jgi:hypothetical protein